MCKVLSYLQVEYKAEGSGLTDALFLLDGGLVSTEKVRVFFVMINLVEIKHNRLQNIYM